MMNGPEKSDSAILAMKPANKAGAPAAEWAERRAATKGNAGHRTRDGLRAAIACHRGWTRVRAAACSGVRRQLAAKGDTGSPATGEATVRSRVGRVPDAQGSVAPTLTRSP